MVQGQTWGNEFGLEIHTRQKQYVFKMLTID